MKTDAGILDLLRIAALIAIAVGTMGSEILVVRAGGGSQRLLTVIFVVWILLPFVALAWANIVSRSWPDFVRVTLYCTTLVIALGSLAFYGGVIRPPANTGRAFVFVAGPLGSWAVMVILVLIAARITRRRSRL